MVVGVGEVLSTLIIKKIPCLNTISEKVGGRGIINLNKETLTYVNATSEKVGGVWEVKFSTLLKENNI